MPATFKEYEGADDDAKITAWIADVLDDADALPHDTLHENLKSGVVLCNLVNVIQPNSVKKVSKLPSPFPQRENVRAFIEAVRAIGVPDAENFDTDDLFEGRNMRQVTLCLVSLGRKLHDVEGYDGATWVKHAVRKLGNSDGKKFEVKEDALWGKSNAEYVATRHN